MHKNLHLLEVGRRVLVNDINQEDGSPRPLIRAVIYGFVNKRGKLCREYKEYMTSFFCSVDVLSPTEGLGDLGDDAFWDIAWIEEVLEESLTKEELLTHRCSHVRQLALRK